MTIFGKTATVVFHNHTPLISLFIRVLFYMRKIDSHIAWYNYTKSTEFKSMNLAM